MFGVFLIKTIIERSQVDIRLDTDTVYHGTVYQNIEITKMPGDDLTTD